MREKVGGRAACASKLLRAFLPGNRRRHFRKPPVLGFYPRSYGLTPRHAQGTALLSKCRPRPEHGCSPLKNGGLRTRAVGMSCSCARQGRPRL